VEKEYRKESGQQSKIEFLVSDYKESLWDCVSIACDAKITPLVLFAYVAEDQSCASERRLALSRLYFRTSGYFSQQDLFSANEESWVSQRGAKPATSCPPRIKELFVDSGLLHTMVAGQDQQLPPSESLLKEAIRAIFPSRELARLALQFTTNPKRLQQNHF
jgi:thyroglobulin